MTDITKRHWRPNSRVLTCTDFSCHKTFPFGFGRHHCRRCGNIFCSKHCNKLLKLAPDAKPSAHGHEYRVCETCFQNNQEELHHNPEIEKNNFGEHVTTLTKHRDTIINIIKYEDFIYTCGLDGAIIKWSAHDNKFEKEHFLTWTSTGERIVAYDIIIFKNFIYAGQNDGFIKVIRIEDMKTVRLFTAHTSPITGLCLFGDILLSAASEIHGWENMDANPKVVITLPKKARSLKREGSILYALCDHGVEVLDLVAPKNTIATLDHEGVTSFILHNDIILTSSYIPQPNGAIINIWKTFEKIFTIRSNLLSVDALGINSRYIFFADYQEILAFPIVNIFKKDDGKSLVKFKHPAGIGCRVFYADEKFLYCGKENSEIVVIELNKLPEDALAP